MPGKLFYLLTLLPPLPEIGSALPQIDLYDKVRQEESPELSLLADLLQTEEIIKECAMNYFVSNTENYKPVFFETTPEDFRELISNNELEEAQWSQLVYTRWFKLLIDFASQTGSNLLKDWAEWELALKNELKSERESRKGQSTDSTKALEIITDNGFLIYDHKWLVQSYYAIENPMQAEKFLDTARIDFIHQTVNKYSFDIDELTAYMLEMRIHRRYEGMSPQQGRKILEEVITL